MYLYIFFNFKTISIVIITNYLTRIRSIDTPVEKVKYYIDRCHHTLCFLTNVILNG